MKNSILKKTRLHKVIFDRLRDVSTSAQEYTRPEIQRNISQYGVRINNVLVFNRLEWVLPFDSVEFDHWPQRSHGNFDEIALIAEERDFFVFYKPPGIVIEAGAGHQHSNFITWMLKTYPDQKELGELNRYGLVHRLDKDTQGLLLIARTPSSYNWLKSQFKERKVIKRYFAILDGLLTTPIDITSYNTRDKENPTRQKGFDNEHDAAEYNSQYRIARSTFKPLIISKEIDQSLVEVTIHTGRMHQIRLHAEMLNLPLSGDSKYNKIHKNKHLLSDTFAQANHTLITNKTKLVDSIMFDSLRKSLFLPSSFSLLSNYLEFQDSDKTKFAFEYKSVDPSNPNDLTI